MFGSSSALIRLDMSEYMEKHSVSRLIGSPPGYVGYGEGGQLTEKVRRHPYSVLLFDEIEKAHPDVFNLLLQILEDGILTDSQGRQIDFRNTVVIMTSNVGAGEIQKERTLGFAEHTEESRQDRMHEKMMEALKEKFRPEFLNRIDEIIIFHPLSRENMSEIAKIMLKEVSDRADGLGLHLSFEPSAIDLLVSKGFHESYGARPLRRTVVRLIEDRLSTALLEGKIQNGDFIRIYAENDEILFERQTTAQNSAEEPSNILQS